MDRAAHDALLVLSKAAPEHAASLLGPEADVEGAVWAQRELGRSLSGENRIERVLELMGHRIHAQWPAPSPQRRAALLLLMAARGTARTHGPLGFDAALAASLD